MTRRPGMTLVELLLVIAILAVLAMLVVPLVSGTFETSQKQATEANLVQLRDVIMNTYRADMKKLLPRPGASPLPPTRVNKPQLRYLFVNPENESLVPTYDPVYRVGWRGPYLLYSAGQYTVIPAAGFTTDYGETGDPTVMDGWNRPIVLQEDATLGKAWLVSAGLDGILGSADDLKLELY